MGVGIQRGQNYLGSTHAKSRFGLKSNFVYSLSIPNS